jgi:hypothetical protein
MQGPAPTTALTPAKNLTTAAIGLGKLFAFARRLCLKLLVRLYNNRTYHRIVALPLAPLDTAFGYVYKFLERKRPIVYWPDAQSASEPSFQLLSANPDLPVAPDISDARGKYVTTIVGTYVDAERVEALLPKGLSLDPARIKNGKHALILMFGYTQNLRRGFWPLPGMSYLEFVVGVPNVMLDEDKSDSYITRFFYIPVLYLNRFYPTLLGWLAGYRKRWKRIQVERTSFMNLPAATYRIQSLLRGKKILEASFHPPVVREVIVTKIERWADLLEQPNVNLLGGENLFLHYYWDWDHAQAFEPVDATVTVYEDIPGLAPGTYQFRGLDERQWQDPNAPEGSVTFVSPFELLPPFSLALLRQHPPKSATQTPVSPDPDAASPNADSAEQDAP